MRILWEYELFYGCFLISDCNFIGYVFDIEFVFNLFWLVLRCDYKGNFFVIVCFKSE